MVYTYNVYCGSSAIIIIFCLLRAGKIISRYVLLGTYTFICTAWDIHYFTYDILPENATVLGE